MKETYCRGHLKMRREQSETSFVLVSAGERAQGGGGETAQLGERDVLLWWKRRRRRRELQATRGQLEGGREGVREVKKMARRAVRVKEV